MERVFFVLSAESFAVKAYLYQFCQCKHKSDNIKIYSNIKSSSLFSNWSDKKI